MSLLRKQKLLQVHCETEKKKRDTVELAFPAGFFRGARISPPPIRAPKNTPAWEATDEHDHCRLTNIAGNK